jgi:hypothetical protein
MTKYFDSKLHIWSIQVLADSLELVLGSSLCIILMWLILLLVDTWLSA